MLHPLQVKKLIPKQAWQQGEALFDAGLVFEHTAGMESAVYRVGHEQREVAFHAGGDMLVNRVPLGELTQEADYAALAAALLFAVEKGAMKKLLVTRGVLAARQVLQNLSRGEEAKEPVALHCTVTRADGFWLSLRIGQEKMYAVQDIGYLLHCVFDGESHIYGKEFTYNPAGMRFSKADFALLVLLRTLFEAVPPQEKKRRLRVSPITLRAVLDVLQATPFTLVLDGEERLLAGVQKGELPVVYEVAGTEDALRLTAHIQDEMTPLHPELPYVVKGDTLVQLGKQAFQMLGAIQSVRENDRAQLHFVGEDARRAFLALLPRLAKNNAVLYDLSFQKRLIAHPLEARVYLNKRGRGLKANVVFAYGEHEISPFGEEEGLPVLLMRDFDVENKVVKHLYAMGFHAFGGELILGREEDVFAFLEQGLQKTQQLCKVFLGQELQKMQIRRPQLSGRLTQAGGALSLQMYDDGAALDDLLPLFKALAQARSYYRLPDGTFLDLRGQEKWQELAKAYQEARAQSPEREDLGAFRAAYLEALIAQHQVPVAVETPWQQALKAPIGEPAVDGLYPYQKRGFAWVVSLTRLRMGGILADEMGLGKTVQMLAAMDYLRRDAAGQMHLVVAPTSLVFNWMKEIERFVPHLRAVALTGLKKQRDKVFRALDQGSKPDIMVTSYPILRQEIARLKAHAFDMMVLDEAQYIKNPFSMAAKAAKRIKAQARFCLSGTPMENHVGDLWSLFDFALPGYFPPHPQFLERFDKMGDVEDLRRRIRPFLMRRLKEEVMEELPPKTEKTLYADMEEEQRRVYQAAWLRRSNEVRELFALSDAGKRRGEVLAAMTELRQVCCHPRLVLPKYTGSSAKLDLLCEILPPILQNGHRVLVFSQFTKMLHIIEERLQVMGVSRLYLDGETPLQDRLQLVERFNRGEADVFLISLKAGGTGLNLTGADTVVQFDPWWNPQAEDQAVDRAHRVGQEKHVQVFRLVTSRSIEEQVVKMGQGKRRLFDALITPGEQMPDTLRQEDILALFDDQEQERDEGAEETSN